MVTVNGRSIVGASAVNRFQRKQIPFFEPCAGTVIGAGGKIIGAIVGRAGLCSGPQIPVTGV